MTAQDFGELVSHVKKSGTGFTARCPAHDDERSSLSFADGDKGLVVRCHANCTIEGICTALGISVASLFHPNGRNGASHGRKIAATYDYVDLDGRLVYQAVRYDPKGFSVRRPVGHNDWAPNLDGVTTRVVYRLPELQGHQDAYIVEGEKDADRLGSIGVPATTNLGGAGKWRDTYTEQLLSAGISRFIIIPDNDRAGQAHAELVARSLAAAYLDPKDVRVLRLPGFPPVREKHGEDVSDWLDAGHTVEELQGLVASTPPFDPAPSASPPSEDPGAPAAGVSWHLYDAADPWDVTPPETLIEGFLMAAGVTWWGGLPKQFKSLMLLYICLCISARREAVANHFRIRQWPRILYVTEEDGLARLAERRSEILSAWGHPRLEPGALRFVIRPHLDLLNAEHVAWLRATCLNQGTTLLILDTWTSLSPTADPMAAKDQARLADIVVKLAEAIGHVIVVDHSRKNRPDGQPISPADIFGPLQKWQRADTTVMLSASSDRQRLEVAVEGKDIDSSRFFLSVRPRGSTTEKFLYTGTIAELADAQRAVGDANRERIRLIVSQGVSPLSRQDISKRLPGTGSPLSEQTVKRHLAALVECGALWTLGKGKALKYTAVRAESGTEPSEPIPPKPDKDLYAARS